MILKRRKVNKRRVLVCRDFDNPELSAIIWLLNYEQLARVCSDFDYFDFVYCYDTYKYTTIVAATSPRKRIVAATQGTSIPSTNQQHREVLFTTGYR